jgi:hypothetical protein
MTLILKLTNFSIRFLQNLLEVTEGFSEVNFRGGVSSIRVFFRNKVKEKCIENDIYPQTHKLLDMIFSKSTRSDEPVEAIIESEGFRVGVSSIRVFFRNEVKKKCIENDIYPQTHKLLDTIFSKSTRSDEPVEAIIESEGFRVGAF